MKELLDKLSNQVVTKLWDIVRECEDEDGFSSPQMLDDAKDCVYILGHIQSLLKDSSIR